MSKPILVGYDPAKADRAPVEFGVAAARFTGAPLIVLSVESGSEGVARFADALKHAEGHVDEDLLHDCSGPLEAIEARLRAEGIQVECRKLQSTSAARALHEAAEH